MELKKEQKEILNSIYKFQFDEVEADREESIYFRFKDIESKDLDGLLNDMVSKGVVNKNGDRLSVNSNMVNKLIKEGVLDIGELLDKLAYDRYYMKNSLDRADKIIEKLNNELVEYKRETENITKKFMNLSLEFDKEKEELKKCNEDIKDAKKRIDGSMIKLIEILGVFIALFTLISVNINFIDLIGVVETLGAKILLLISINAVTLMSVGMVLVFIRKIFKE